MLKNKFYIVFSAFSAVKLILGNAFWAATHGLLCQKINCSVHKDLVRCRSKYEFESS